MSVRKDGPAAFAAFMSDGRLPWRAVETKAGLGSIVDADGEQVAVVDPDREHADHWVLHMAQGIVLAVNTCGGFTASRTPEGVVWS